ncbi:histidine kinase [Streptomyces sp. NPDC021020]|uniref:sensor histidine kinase n=1 Tax=Streptomyces sp. NPDC021020 TaxID=3365109 RepID=UPI0037A17087
MKSIPKVWMSAPKSARAAGYCAVTFLRGLLLVVLVPVLVYSAVLCLVGLGLLVLPVELRLLRRLADGERARLGRWAAAAAPAGPHEGRRLAAALSDPATGRDLRWAPAAMVAGTALGLLGAALFVLPAAVAVLACLWWLFPADQPIRLLLDLPVDSWWAVLYAGAPDLLLSVLLALVGPPLVARLAASVSRWLLAPSPAAVLAERVSALDRTRTGALTAHGSELRRIERDLHDGTQARLVSLAMQLGLAERTLPTDPAAVGPLLARAREGAEEAMAELRDVLRSVYPPVLADRGLAGAVSAVAARCPVPVAVDVGELGEVPPHVEAAVYFAVTEALTNAAKHAHAASVTVTLARSGGGVRAEVGDDGRGGAVEGGGTGLRGIRQRVEAVDGTLRVQSPPGGPTTVTVECPCAS